MVRALLVRIDDRLIHGQVVIKWLRHLGCKEILVVDDDLSRDSFMQDVLRMATPVDVRVRVAPLQDAARELEALSGGHRGVMVLLKTPQAALALLDHGIPFEELNLGGLAGGLGTTRLYKSVSATPEQLAALMDIRERGVRVYVQLVPEERQLDIMDVVPASFRHRQTKPS